MNTVLYISGATAPEYDNSVETGYTETELPVPSPVCRASGSVCRVYTWLFTNLAEWYLLTQCWVCVSLEQMYVSTSGWR